MLKRGYCDSPLSADEVRAIRALRGKMSQAKVAKLYNRTQASISAIMRGATYRDPEPDMEPELPTKFEHITLRELWAHCADGGPVRKMIRMALESMIATAGDPEPELPLPVIPGTTRSGSSGTTQSEEED